jgi:hypothetical protein
MSDLDNILSGQSDALPEQNVADEAVTQIPEGEDQQGQGEATTQEEDAGGGQKFVPQQALHAEKQKTKRYTEEVSSLRNEIAERDAAWERRIAQLVNAQKPQAEQQQPPDQFEDFPGATRHVVQPEFQRIEQQLLAIAKDTAITRFTEDKVNEAERAFINALQSQKLDPADFQKVANSPNRYAEAVRWHQRQLAQAEIGDDPAAYKAKLEAELREKILAETQQGGDQQQTQQRQPVMPTNLAGARNVGSRSGPAWSGPASIDDIFSRQRAG